MKADGTEGRYSLRLSRRGFPVVAYQDEYGLVKWFPWDWLKSQLLGLRLRKMGFATSPRMLKAWKEFRREYRFPASLRKDALLVDVGARDGDSAIWWALQGHTHLRLVEPDPGVCRRLQHNAAQLRRRGCQVEVCAEPFRLEHLEGAAAVKFDCEGCEREVDFASLRIPWITEFHEAVAPSKDGMYPYVRAIGVHRGGVGVE